MTSTIKTNTWYCPYFFLIARFHKSDCKKSRDKLGMNPWDSTISRVYEISCEFAKDRESPGSIQESHCRSLKRTSSRSAYLYLFLLCKRTQSRFEIRRDCAPSEVVRRRRLTFSGSRDRRFAYALSARGSSPKNTRTRDPVSSFAALSFEIILRSRPSRNRYATVRSLTAASFPRISFGNADKVLSMTS